MPRTTIGPALKELSVVFEHGTLAGLTDAQLLERFVERRDEASFTRLVKRHGKLVLGICRGIAPNHEDAQDAFQATFLMLVRKADAIRDGETLGAWLHRVARRVAIRAEQEAARRQAVERTAGTARAASPLKPTDPERAEVLAALHDEIDRLPDRYRLPLVLCHLDALSHAEVARRLRVSERTVRRRLAEAQERLRLRLTRRGLTLSLASLVTILTRSAPAAVPDGLLLATVRTGMAALLGRGVAAGGVSVAALALGEAVARTMLVAKLKAGAAAAVGLATFAGLAVGMVTLAAYPGGSNESGNADDPPLPTARIEPGALRNPVSPPSDEAEDDQTNEENLPIVFIGRVLDPDGQPFEGATLSLHTYALKQPPLLPDLATSDANGRFQFEVPRAAFDFSYSDDAWRHAAVIAQAHGFAFGLDHYADPDAELTLRLARDDVPIEGRVLDLEGRPVVGATVRGREIRMPDAGDLSGWLEALEGEGAAYNPTTNRFLPRQVSLHVPILMPSAMTNAEGRFRLVGIGRERLVGVIIEGPTIETVVCFIQTRSGSTHRIPRHKDMIDPDLVTVHGASFTHIAGPTRPIEGIVRDQDTGTPLAGITIRGERLLFDGYLAYISTRTDADGRYRLVGLPRGREGWVVAEAPVDLPYYGRRKALLGVPSDETLPYLRSRVAVPANPEPGPVQLDIGLKRGVWITGRVMDKISAEPVPSARVEYFVFWDNPYLDEAPGFRRAWNNGAFTDKEGRFHLVAFPGPGLLTALASEDRYIRGSGGDEVSRKNDQGFLETHPYMAVPTNHHVVAEIEPPEDAETFDATLTIDPGRTLTGMVLDPDGKPLPGALASGLKDLASWEHKPFDTAEFTLVGLLPGKGRTLTIRHEERQLIGTVTLAGDEDGPIVVQLGLWGSVSGRVVDDEGQPRPGVQLVGAKTPVSYPETDQEGRFHLEGLVPGQPYRIDFVERRYRRIGTLDREIVVQPGEYVNLGDVRIEPDRDPS